MIPKFKKLYQYVLNVNEPLQEVTPLYKITFNYYDRKEVIYTEDPSDANLSDAPNINIEIDNIEDYENYQHQLYEYINRAEYMYYTILKEIWKDLSEEEFEECYKECWDKYHNEGGWDLVGEMMPSIVESRNVINI